MMPHLLRQVMIVNNDCIHEIQLVPDEPERLIHAFHTLERALSMLRNESSVADMDFSNEQECGNGGQDESSSPHIPDRPTQRNALIPSRQRCSFPHIDTHEYENSTYELFHLYDRPLLFHVPDESGHDENYTLNFVSATVLFNLSLICHLYAMTASERSRSDLLPIARKLYLVLIELLGEVATKSEVSSPQVTNTIVDSNGSQLSLANDNILLSILTYHCLGHLYLELGSLAESSECLMKIQDIFLSQNDCFESNRWSDFDDIIDEIKLNILFWKLYEPSPIAIAA